MVEEEEDVCAVAGEVGGVILDGEDSPVSYLFLTPWAVYDTYRGKRCRKIWRSCFGEMF